MNNKTILYVEDLIEALKRGRLPEFGHVRTALRLLIPDPPATPEPKFKKDDWVVSPALKKDTEPWQVKIPNGRYGAHLINLAGDDFLDVEVHELLAIPPKPEKITEGYDLTGEVEVADGTKPYVEWVGEAGEVVTIDSPANTDSFDGRRWIAKRNNKCTECGQEMPK